MKHISSSLTIICSFFSFSSRHGNARKSIFRSCYDYAVTLGKSLDKEPNMLRTAGRQIHLADAPASTPVDYYLQNMCLLFLDHLIEGLNTRFDKYGSMIHKMHVFVPSVIGMKKVEGNYQIEKCIHECRDDPRNAFEECCRRRRSLHKKFSVNDFFS